MCRRLEIIRDQNGMSPVLVGDGSRRRGAELKAPQFSPNPEGLSGDLGHMSVAPSGFWFFGVVSKDMMEPNQEEPCRPGSVLWRFRSGLRDVQNMMLFGFTRADDLVLQVLPLISSSLLQD